MRFCDTKRKIARFSVAPEASGGILFIDEAYDLYREDNDRDFGNDAITYIMQEMENRKGEFIVIAAGYEQEMDAFLKANPGLNSRFDHHITLPDYDPDELLLIGEAMLAKKRRSLTKEASECFFGELTDRWRKRDRHYGNARTVRNLVQMILKAQGQRMMSQPDHEWTAEAITTIVKEDIQQACRSERHTIFEVPVQEKELQQALTELHKLIGLTELKQEIEQVVTLTRYYKEERKNVAMLHPHIVLKGSPGTGKTIVARLLARIYQALGILEGGHIIEVNRDKLVSSYQGETEKRTKEAIEAAHGGMLFIDEAYQLTQYGIDDIGHKAIETLLTYMEEARGSMIVIVAGYREEMDQFLQANAGLPRRFNQTFDFPDYSPDELLRIAKLIAKEHGYTIAKEAEESLYTIFHKHYSVRDRTFGNAGFVQNIMSQAFKKHDLAIASKTQTERQMLDQQVIHVQHLP